MVDAEKLRLLGLIDGVDPRQHRLNAMELLGYTLIMLHWQRGIIDMLVKSGHIELSEAELENWNRVITNLETYEKFAWELAPARALLPAMRHFRLTGELPEGVELMTAKDELGRIPYGNKDLDYIENTLRRVMDCRIYEMENGSSSNH